MTRWVDGVAVLAWNCFAWLIWATAIVEVIRTPAERFAHRWRTKTGRLIAIAMFSGTIGGLYLPIGAAVVLAGLRRTRHQDQHQQLEAAPSLGPQLPTYVPPPNSDGRNT